MFGKIEEGALHPNKYGQIVLAAWRDLPLHHTTVSLDEFILMPNHLHCLLALQNDVGHDWQPGWFTAPQADSLGTVVGSFKSAVAREVGHLRGIKTVVWQRGLYEHIVRGEKSFESIRRYIIESIALAQR